MRDGGSQLFRRLERPLVVGDCGSSEPPSGRIEATSMSSSRGGPCHTGLCTADRTLAPEVRENCSSDLSYQDGSPVRECGGDDPAAVDGLCTVESLDERCSELNMGRLEKGPLKRRRIRGKQTVRVLDKRGQWANNGKAPIDSSSDKLEAPIAPVPIDHGRPQQAARRCSSGVSRRSIDYAGRLGAGGLPASDSPPRQDRCGRALVGMASERSGVGLEVRQRPGRPPHESTHLKEASKDTRVVQDK